MRSNLKDQAGQSQRRVFRAGCITLAAWGEVAGTPRSRQGRANCGWPMFDTVPGFWRVGKHGHEQSMLSLSFLVHELTLPTTGLHKSQACHQCNLRYIWIRRITKIESRIQALIHPRLPSKSLVRPTPWRNHGSNYLLLSLRPFCSGVIRHSPRLTPMSTRGSDTQEEEKH